MSIRIVHIRTLLVICGIALLAWFSGLFYLKQQLEIQEELYLNGETHAQGVAWQAVSTAHRIAMQSYFDTIIMQPEVMEILKEAQGADPVRENILRVKLYRTLSPTYELLCQRDVRQLHFQTPDNRSFLRFHAPHNSGDSLVKTRPSVVQANKTLKPVFGFETGRVVIGFRNVFPIVWQGRHLGSVELSQPFEAIRKGLHDLEPRNEYLLALKGSVLLPKLFEEHKKLYAPTDFSPDWLQEDPHRELPDSAAPLSPSTHRYYEQLKHSDRFKLLLESGKPGTVAVRLGGKICQISLIPLKEADEVVSAVLLSFSPSPQLDELYVSHRINMVFFTILVLFGSFAVYLFQSSLQTVLEQEQQLGLITANIADGIYVMDQRGTITFANQRAAELLGFSREELQGAVAHNLFHHHGGNEPMPLEECPIFKVIQSNNRYNGEEVFSRKEGSLLPVMVASQPMLDGKRIVGSVTVFRDISEQKQTEEQLRLMSITDPLTGVYNRRFLQETLLKELHRAERHAESFSLIAFDLDRFKQVNDLYGHATGDRVLRHVVELVQGRIRGSDLLARWGGEEFLLLLPATTLDAAGSLAESLLQALRAAPVSGVGSVTASFGVTTWRLGDTVDQLVHRADALMYDAKQAGRNCVRTDFG